MKPKESKTSEKPKQKEKEKTKEKKKDKETFLAKMFKGVRKHLTSKAEVATAQSPWPRLDDSNIAKILEPESEGGEKKLSRRDNAQFQEQLERDSDGINDEGFEWEETFPSNEESVSNEEDESWRQTFLKNLQEEQSKEWREKFLSDLQKDERS